MCQRTRSKCFHLSGATICQEVSLIGADASRFPLLCECFKVGEGLDFVWFFFAKYDIIVEMGHIYGNLTLKQPSVDKRIFCFLFEGCQRRRGMLSLAHSMGLGGIPTCYIRGVDVASGCGLFGHSNFWILRRFQFSIQVRRALSSNFLCLLSSWVGPIRNQ